MAMVDALVEDGVARLHRNGAEGSIPEILADILLLLDPGGADVEVPGNAVAIIERQGQAVLA